MALNFARSGKKSAGKFSRTGAYEAVNNDLGSIGLSERAKHYIAKKVDGAGNVTGEKMNEIINEAHSVGYLSDKKAESIKDAMSLPDNMNDHLK